MKAFKDYFTYDEIEDIGLMVESMDGLMIEGKRTTCFDIIKDLLNDKKQIYQFSSDELIAFIDEFGYYVKTTESFSFVDMKFFYKVNKVLMEIVEMPGDK